MALLGSAHRISVAGASARSSPQRKLHPSICLLTGFGFIVGSALAVHVVFNALI
ncbi:MAG: hypothetical protein V4701_04880 [Pseudomonadota bacterium]